MKTKSYEVGQWVRFMFQAGGFGVGKITERFEKNKHAYRVQTATGEFTVMSAEITGRVPGESVNSGNNPYVARSM